MELCDITELENNFDNTFLSISMVLNESVSNIEEAKEFIKNDIKHNKIKICVLLKQAIINNDIEHFCYLFLASTMALPHIYEIEKVNDVEKGERIGEILSQYFMDNR